MAKKEVVKTEVKKRESNLDLLDLMNGARAIIKVKGEVEFSKLVIWDNTDGQQGVMKKSIIYVTVRDDDGREKRFVIADGKKNPLNHFVGAEKKKIEQGGTKEIAL